MRAGGADVREEDEMPGLRAGAAGAQGGYDDEEAVNAGRGSPIAKPPSPKASKAGGLWGTSERGFRFVGEHGRGRPCTIIIGRRDACPTERIRDRNLLCTTRGWTVARAYHARLSIPGRRGWASAPAARKLRQGFPLRRSYGGQVEA